MKRLATYALLLLTIYVNGATITALDGRSYRNAKVTRSDPVGVHIVHSTGACYVPFTNLPQSVRDGYGYESDKAAAHTAAQQQVVADRQLAVQRLRETTAARRAVIRPLFNAPEHNASVSTPVQTKTTTGIGGRERDYSEVDYSSRNYSTGRVQVKGYYRKDGTYVRPHTRKR